MTRVTAEETRLIGGRYQLDELLGEGGMGSVWRATDRTLQRSVAVKLLFSGDERDRDRRMDRFLREARIAAAVQHRHVVHIVDFGSTEHGRPYMVMEHLRGENLAERFSRSPAPTLEDVVQWMASVLAGLSAAHEAGIVHRDMKPDNVFLVDDADGAYPKILDFGISRSLQPESGPSSALTTKEGFLIGTPQYMSPEQARGLRDIDRSTDLYSIGVILYEAVTGRLPYDSEHVGDLIIQIAAGDALPIATLRPEVGEALSAVVEQAMATDRHARFPDARAMRDALLGALDQMEPEARALPARSRARPPTARERAATAAATRKERPGDSGPLLDALAATMPAHQRLAADVPPPAESVETPRAWTVSGGAAPGRSSRIAWVVALGLVTLAVGTWVATRSAGPGGDGGAGPVAAPPLAEPAPGPVEDPGPAADPEPAPEPVPAEPATVTVRLEGLPEDATVHVDGEPVPGDPVELSRDGAEHRIEVTAPGKRPWATTHLADADGTYAVALEPARSTRPAGAARTRSGARMSAGAPPATLRELDY